MGKKQPRELTDAQQFAALLVRMVEGCYCVGAATPAELHYAVYDFLILQAKKHFDRIPSGTVCPSRR